MTNANLKIDTTFLDGLIVGRVEPHIYAFSTETVPNYLKVGDTARGVRVRLDEWRKIFPNLVQQYEHSAQIDDETIFRDLAVHTFLEQEKGRTRLLPDTFGHLPYYSKEFFEGATTVDLEEAISDIYQSAREKNGKYQFYSPDRLPQIFTYERTESYPPRDNQQQVIDNFRNAVAAGRTNLLLYAVMRFGKSFTAMCCAKEMDAKIVVVVSAKADVKQEWKKTVESHVYFSGYKFLDSTSLNSNENIISDTLAAGDKVALFLTLQDLQGKEIKAKHKEVFEHQIDLLIVDETHFGARGASYGKVLQQYNLSKSQIKKELQSIDGFETLDQLRLRSLSGRIVVFSVSNYSDDLITALKRGADGYLLKDMEPEELLAALKQAAAGKMVVSPTLTPILAQSLREDRSEGERDIDQLTPRERDILKLLAQGLSNKMIARKLDITESTVKVHVKHLLKKMKLKSRVEVAVWVHQQRVD